jgi:phenylpyruvate tautomerase PptA (4-oxalocrotonate tautomerase family)
MPLMDLTYPEGTIDAETREAMVDDLTTVLLRAERAPDTQFFRDIAWVHVHELPGEHMLAAGKPIDRPVVKLEVTTPEGALSDRRRAEFVENATKVIREAMSIPDEDALRVWILHREIAEGSWGAGGQVIQFKALAEAAVAERAKAERAEPVPG